jgi:hypothetical protein
LMAWLLPTSPSPGPEPDEGAPAASPVATPGPPGEGAPAASPVATVTLVSHTIMMTPHCQPPPRIEPTPDTGLPLHEMHRVARDGEGVKVRAHKILRPTDAYAHTHTRTQAHTHTRTHAQMDRCAYKRTSCRRSTTSANSASSPQHRFDILHTAASAPSLDLGDTRGSGRWRL